MHNVFIPKYIGKNDILSINSHELPRLTWSLKRECWRYRKQIEDSRKPGRKVIDEINVGKLVAWNHPIKLGIQMLNPGGRVHIPAGTYTIEDDDSEITLVDNCLITGSGYATVVKQSKTKSDQMQVFTVLNKSNVTFQNLSFDGDSSTIFAAGYSNEHDHAISSVGSDNVKIINCDFYSFNGDCIYIASHSTYGGSENILVQGCTFYNPEQQSSPVRGRNCLSIVAKTDDVKRVRISGCRFKDGNPACIDIEPDVSGGVVKDVVISNCTFEHESGEQYRGIAIEPTTTGVTVKDVLVSNCTFYYHNYGITLTTTNKATNMDSITISGCNFDTCNYGIWGGNGSNNVRVNNCQFRSCGNGVDFVYNNNNIAISNCDFRKCTGSAITFPGSSGNENENVLINNNMVMNASYGNVNSYSCIYLNNTDRVRVIGNTIMDDQVTPTGKYPLEALGCDRISYIDNYAEGMSTSSAPYFGSCTNNERRNNWEGDLETASTNNNDIRQLITGSLRIGGDTEDGEDGIKIHALANYGYIDLKGGGYVTVRVDDSDGSTSVINIHTDKLEVVKSLEVTNNVVLGADSTKTLTCNGRLILRTLAADPTGTATSGNLGEIAFYGTKAYVKHTTTGSDTNWTAL